MPEGGRWEASTLELLGSVSYQCCCRLAGTASDSRAAQRRPVGQPAQAPQACLPGCRGLDSAARRPRPSVACSSPRLHAPPSAPWRGSERPSGADREGQADTRHLRSQCVHLPSPPSRCRVHAGREAGTPAVLSPSGPERTGRHGGPVGPS